VADDGQIELWLADRHLDYHLRQFNEPYRSTVHLREFVEDQLRECCQPYRAIDVGGGAGANAYHLSESLINTSWTVLDINETLFDLGKSIMKKKAMTMPVQFIAGDFYHLDELFDPKSFDLVFSIQTLSWLPNYEQALFQLLRLSKKVTFVTSLFTDFLVDAHVEVTQYKDHTKWKGEGPYIYNIYCFERFRDFCIDHGAKRVIATDFQIDIDLAPPSNQQMSTYTSRLEDGRRVQRSGPLLMPWKFIAIWMY
jgi:hypothetical protein